MKGLALIWLALVRFGKQPILMNGDVSIKIPHYIDYPYSSWLLLLNWCDRLGPANATSLPKCILAFCWVWTEMTCLVSGFDLNLDSRGIKFATHSSNEIPIACKTSTIMQNSCCCCEVEPHFQNELLIEVPPRAIVFWGTITRSFLAVLYPQL